MSRRLRGFAFGIFAGCLLVAGTAVAARAAFNFHPEQTFLDGLWRLSFVAPEGRVTLLLPERLLPGRMVSGTIELEPRGKGSDLVANLAALRSYSLRLDGEELSAASKSLRWRLPESQPSSRIELLDRGGAARTQAFANLTLADSARVNGPEAKDGQAFTFPELTQRGRTIVIHGAFDGDFATTRVTLGGLEAEKVAESPELLVVRNPAQRLGRLAARITEGAVRERIVFNNFDIRFETPKRIARPGEVMSLSVRVEGVQGLRRAYPVVVYNHSPEVAAFKGGDANRASRMMDAAHVDAQGVFGFDVPVAVLKEGEMDVDGDVVVIVVHIANVTWPPHVVNVTPTPYHVTNVTWPPHTTNVTFPGYHAANVTFPPHYPNVTFPPSHNTNVTWPPHVVNQSIWIYVVEDTPPVRQP